MPVPRYDQLFNPLLTALKTLGSSASIDELEEAVTNLLQLSDDEVNETHKGNTTKLSYRLAWARSYLKQYGLLENSSRGIWALTPKGTETEQVDPAAVKAFVRKNRGAGKSKTADLDEEPAPEALDWRDDMLAILKALHPSAFERLCQRLLREAGFVQVKVTGRSGDGGIDGTGLVRIGGFLSFRVIFQCKRYQNSVSSQLMREFKGTMVGRADKGLFLTTGTFTRDAKAEATRDGAPPVDLVDGYDLVDKMKELGLAVRIRMEEVVEVDIDWLKGL